eukprot:TRINITY_DN1137_c0_g1_i7.p1 TRINITY_DN1137_c0_g1~~TRINITY_DN1137_c0_g1_i7.p1  ORF type:complete len:301 (-),score=102.22 TRINITY_DN1137_c0_g1_i7:449-1351(-)
MMSIFASCCAAPSATAISGNDDPTLPGKAQETPFASLEPVKQAEAPKTAPEPVKEPVAPKTAPEPVKEAEAPKSAPEPTGAPKAEAAPETAPVEPAKAEEPPADANGLSGEMHYKYPIEMPVPMTVIVDNAGGGSTPGIACDFSCEKLCLVQMIMPKPGLVFMWNKEASPQQLVQKWDRVCRVSAKAMAKTAPDINEALKSGGRLTLNMEHPGEIKASVKKNGKALGLKLKQLEDMKGVVIEEISDGIIKDMNESGAIKPALKPWDVIVEVNGKSKFGDELQKQVETLEEFTLKVHAYKI